MSKSIKKRGFLSNKSHFFGMVVLIVILLGLVVDANKTSEDNFYSDIIRFDNVATKIHQNYVKEVNSEELTDKAIDGMLEILDPHTTYFKRKQYEELRIQTEGKFGGLGIQISIREKVLTVMTPISGTPASRAGIRSGDQIIEIEGKSTKGITIEKAVAKLRGEPGSDVSITIRRKGHNEDLKFTITRQIITIKSVPFYGILKNGIGYIKLVSFSQDAGEEVEKAIKLLLKQDLKGLILDLRFNPGGLLNQAISVSGCFLKKGSLVVSTKGRVRGQNKKFDVSSKPVLPQDMPLAILVNAASASAAEIVSGAVQDWDRGVIIGDTTYGKGSVQSILPIDKDHHIKLTTAFYYTPSGRCINKPENGIRGEINEEDTTSDTTDTVTVKDSVYHTNLGREVIGGGGIIPDTIVEMDIPSLVVRSFLLKDVFFKFANIEYPRLKKKNIVLDSSFVVSDKIMKDFNTFIDSIDFKFKTYAEVKFDEFMDKAGLVDSTADSADGWYKKPKWTPKEKTELNNIVASMKKMLKSQSLKEFKNSSDDIKRYIKEVLLVHELGQDNEIVYRTKLSKDKQVDCAIKLLSDKKAYKNAISLRKKK